MLQAACQALLGWPSATRLKTEWMAQIDREKLNYAFGSQGMVIVLYNYKSRLIDFIRCGCSIRTPDRSN